MGQGSAISNTVYNVTGNNALVDWVQIELRDVNDFSIVLYATSGLVQRDGNVVRSDGVSLIALEVNLPSNFYVTVQHKSHLIAMSATPVSFVNTVASYDFTVQNGYTNSGTSQQELASGVWGLYTENSVSGRDINGADNGVEQLVKKIVKANK